MPPLHTARRKDDHIRINLEEDVSFGHLTTGLEHYHFVHEALPEVDMAAIDTCTRIFDKPLSFPLMISSMTGGTKRAGEINQVLAAIAQEKGIGMGLGSMRVALEKPDTNWTFQVRNVAPDIPLFANLGAVQLNLGYGPEHCQRLVDLAQADGLYLHLNALQEALQPEGDTNFAGLLRQIEKVCRALDVPVIIKEVGWGLSAKTARLLVDAGVAALDVAGAGGTSWSQVEMYRSENHGQREVAASFRDWGIPTAESVLALREAFPEVPVFASGGIKTGIDVAKCMALGANAATMAGVMLRAAIESEDRLREQIDVIYQQFKITMFATGCANIPALQQTDLIYR